MKRDAHRAGTDQSTWGQGWICPLYAQASERDEDLR